MIGILSKIRNYLLGYYSHLYNCDLQLKIRQNNAKKIGKKMLMIDNI